jgi:IBR domain, a half RING-finger domain
VLNARPTFGSRITCSSCSTSYCADHGLAHGPDETCFLYLRRMARSDRASADEIARTTVRCPGCCRLISKSTGCNHMTCNRCHIEFCYLCASAIPGPWAELHFADCNILGCPDMQFSGGEPNSRAYIWWLNFFTTYPVMLLALPVVLVFSLVISLCSLACTLLCLPCLCVGLFVVDDREVFFAIPIGIFGPYLGFFFYVVSCFPWIAGCCSPCTRCVIDHFD